MSLEDDLAKALEKLDQHYEMLNQHHDQINGLERAVGEVLDQMDASAKADKRETDQRIENLLGDQSAILKRLEALEQGSEATQENVRALLREIVSINRRLPE